MKYQLTLRTTESGSWVIVITHNDGSLYGETLVDGDPVGVIQLYSEQVMLTQARNPDMTYMECCDHVLKIIYTSESRKHPID